jgi:hypothetical protein
LARPHLVTEQNDKAKEPGADQGAHKRNPRTTARLRRFRKRLYIDDARLYGRRMRVKGLELPITISCTAPAWQGRRKVIAMRRRLAIRFGR